MHDSSCEICSIDEEKAGPAKKGLKGPRRLEVLNRADWVVKDNAGRWTQKRSRGEGVALIPVNEGCHIERCVLTAFLKEIPEFTTGLDDNGKSAALYG